MAESRYSKVRHRIGRFKRAAIIDDLLKQALILELLQKYTFASATQVLHQKTFLTWEATLDQPRTLSMSAPKLTQTRTTFGTCSSPFLATGLLSGPGIWSLDSSGTSDSGTGAVCGSAGPQSSCRHRNDIYACAKCCGLYFGRQMGIQEAGAGEVYIDGE
jgi:hypothetical protein